MKLAAAILACALVSGCATVTVSREGATMVNIENSGWYLLNFIPIASGNPARPNSCTTRLFSKTVTLENNVKMLDKVIHDEGAVAVRDINSFTIDEHVMLILLKRHSYHTSAQLLMKDDLEDTKLEGISTILPKEF
jgi:hypothetical protein